MSLAASRSVEGEHQALRSPSALERYEPLLAQPARVKDELAWELVRDEWELLLAVGSGPTTVEAAARSLAMPVAGVAKRMKLLAQHGLVSPVADVAGEAFRLVPAFYERREGMSSYLRDLVLRRLQDGAGPPLAGRARLQLGGPAAIETLIARAERELFPAVVALANRPESDRSERFSLFFATAESAQAGTTAIEPYDGQGFRQQLLHVLRSAATAKSLAPDTRSAYIWVAEMRTDPEVAGEIGDLFERFLEAVPSVPSAERHGAAAFAVLPAALNSKRPTAGPPIGSAHHRKSES